MRTIVFLFLTCFYISALRAHALPSGPYREMGGCFACQIDDDGMSCTCPDIKGRPVESHISHKHIAQCGPTGLDNADGDFVCDGATFHKRLWN